MLGLKDGEVKLVPYEANWPQLYEEEKSLLLETLGERILAIEHIGSTAIPGMPSKPIIDIVVAVHSLDSIDDFIEKMSKLGYEYSPPTKYLHSRFFLKGSKESRTYHIALTTLDSDYGWINKIIFRDFLRYHEDEREQYKKLKLDLAGKYANNREEYTDKKSDFREGILEKARK